VGERCTARASKPSALTVLRLGDHLLAKALAAGEQRAAEKDRIALLV
jgi:hypothetical protein